MKLATIMILLASAAYSQQPENCVNGPTTPPAPPLTTWDNSGNSLLTGAYNFRYVQFTVGDQLGDLSHAVALDGTITFTSAGTFTIKGATFDSNSMQTAMFTPPSFPTTYSIGACGFGFLTNPLSQGDLIWGAVSAGGVFVGSTTETQSFYNDLFVAAPATPTFTNSSLSGSYSVAYMNFPDGYAGDTVTAGFQMAPDGKGDIGAVNVQMFQGSSSTAVDLIEPVNYSFNSGIGTLNFPNYSPAISQPKYLYISPDKNFIFGGGAEAFDLFVGVLTEQPGPTSGTGAFGFGASTFTGLYYQAGIDQIMSSTKSATLQTYYGAFQAESGMILDHQRILAPLRAPVQPIGYPYQAYSSTFADAYSLSFGANIGYYDANTIRDYVIGSNGTLRLGFGQYPNLGISIALKAPALSTTPAIYIYPTGVVNAASYAPYTTGISPGEAIAIYGSGFSTGDTLFINGNQVNADVESSSQIEAVVPSSLAGAPSSATGTYAQIQILCQPSGSNTCTAPMSNVVWALINKTTPGILTQSQNGLGDADAFPSATSVTFVTQSSPAVAGSTIYLDAVGLGKIVEPAGIGGVFGAQGSATLTTLVTATIGGIAAAVTFPGLSSTNNSSSAATAGLYTMALVVPAGITTAGDLPVVISTPDGVAAQATIQVGPAPASSK